ncbi:MAG: aminoacyl-tRNA hydrolase [Alphaproteobacteria bacterium]|jgi:ribosome-associated protein|nr:aminoacyl-tRNA hydrolase [Alphaproteobacteria bacterium]MBT4964889.1 aminoacyl-tRNA hydrolase [Alphaproteobacteria bacterium]MBT5918615.1 aminoacyl-tRNA hydrolase [Alphaproteobacteria bacterium]MBT6387662.1 aminoacyl-tRNA hydrolase [Alphaproteobacteria bacterium]MBT7746583.1 aminoacyl-tRNA hydrolase [Alphaproteobacteria bacterium]
MIKINDQITLDPSDLTESFVRSTGPGGQNVNKVSTAVQLRFNARQCKTLPTHVYLRLAKLVGSKLTKDGFIIITANKHRSQDRNRTEAVERLVELIREAAIVPKFRRATKPSKSAKAKRVDTKKQRSSTKQKRGRVPQSDY